MQLQIHVSIDKQSKRSKTHSRRTFNHQQSIQWVAKKKKHFWRNPGIQLLPSFCWASFSIVGCYNFRFSISIKLINNNQYFLNSVSVILHYHEHPKTNFQLWYPSSKTAHTGYTEPFLSILHTRHQSWFNK